MRILFLSKINLLLRIPERNPFAISSGQPVFLFYSGSEKEPQRFFPSCLKFGHIRKIAQKSGTAAKQVFGNKPPVQKQLYK